MLFLSNFVNRGDIVAVNLVERCERRALVKVMKTMLSKFAYLSGEHCLRNSHVNLGQGVNSLDYSSVMGLYLKLSDEKRKILTLSSMTLLSVCNSSYVASCLLNLYFSNFLESCLETDSFCDCRKLSSNITIAMSTSVALT